MWAASLLFAAACCFRSNGMVIAGEISGMAWHLGICVVLLDANL